MNVFKYIEKDNKIHNTDLWKDITKIELYRDGIVLKRDREIVVTEKPIEQGIMYVIEEAQIESNI